MPKIKYIIFNNSLSYGAVSKSTWVCTQNFLVKYGWQHQEAGKRYKENEMSFRQTVSGLNFSDRGFKVVVDRLAKKFLISFNAAKVDVRHAE